MLVQEKPEEQDFHSLYTPNWSQLDMSGAFEIILKQLDWNYDSYKYVVHLTDAPGRALDDQSLR